MDLPSNSLLPFFAYGVFRPGELGFLRIKPFVQTAIPATTAGGLLIRDGLPLLDQGTPGEIRGTLLGFLPESAGQAYYRIVGLEPDHQYKWSTAKVKLRKGNAKEVNVLAGTDLKNGTVEPDSPDWNGRDDPMFKEGLDVVAAVIPSKLHPGPPDFAMLFRLQMAYLLLWSILERYTSMRYHLAGDVMGKVQNLAQEPAFERAFRREVKEDRTIYRVDDPDKDKKVKLSPSGSAKKALEYYYQVRCNVTHRGKAASRDLQTMYLSTRELFAITSEVIGTAFLEAQWHGPA
jgi:hypothetical protein